MNVYKNGELRQPYQVSTRVMVVTPSQARADDYRREGLTSAKHIDLQQQHIRTMEGAVPTTGNGALWSPGRHTQKLPRTAPGYDVDGNPRNGAFRLRTIAAPLTYRSSKEASAVECEAEVITDADMSAITIASSIQLVWIPNQDNTPPTEDQTRKGKEKFYQKALFLCTHLRNELSNQIELLRKVASQNARSSDPTKAAEGAAFQSGADTLKKQAEILDKTKAS